MRAEYPLAVRTVTRAIQQARDAWAAGRRGSWDASLDFDIQVFQGSGAFVCGEETALIASIEGNRGMPRTGRPIRRQSGLDGRPTVINNVKTFAAVPAHPAQWARLVSAGSAPGQPGNGHFFRGGQRGSPRSGGNPHGHDPADADLRHLRRHSQEEEIQGGPDRRAIRRLPSGVAFSTRPSISTHSRRPAP